MDSNQASIQAAQGLGHADITSMIETFSKGFFERLDMTRPNDGSRELQSGNPRQVRINSSVALKALNVFHLLLLFTILTDCAKATTFYVNAYNTNPITPYTNWLMAATNIEDAIAVTAKGDTVLVTNGIYAFGGLAMAGNLTNRVALTNAITVESVNGPWVTTIAGAGAANGAAAVRCAWLTNGASLIGFTLTGGATQTSGNFSTTESGGGVWCASSNAFVRNCVIISNTAYEYGGAVYQGTLTTCLVSSNTASFSLGGAIYQSLLNNCTVVRNGNYGEVSSFAMTNCIIYFNGSSGSQNCGGNSPPYFHCCTTPALFSGSGNFTNPPAFLGNTVRLQNNSPCIGAGINIGVGTDIFGNAYSNPPSVGCAEWTPMPLVGTPQITLTVNPVGFSAGNLVIGGSLPFSFAWLQDGTPLSDNGHFIGTQTTNLTSVGVSLADAGNYQVIVSNSFGVVTSSVATLVLHCVDVAGSNPVAPYLTWATAATNIQDAISASAAEDVVLVTNGLYASGGKSMDGIITNRVSLDKPILVNGVNGPSATWIQGALDSTATNGPGAVRCAWMTNNAILSGFTLFHGATRAVTPSVNSSMYGGGVFATSNNAVAYDCVLATNYASYEGGGAYSATLLDCTLTQNQAVGSGTAGAGIAGAGVGGGAEKSKLINCFVLANFADQGNGGGADTCNLRNCALVGNSSYLEGGAANGGSLVNCTVTSNTASSYNSGYGGAVSVALMTNCIVVGNFSRYSYPNTNYNSCTLTYCCSDPLPAGTGNVDVNPQLLADDIHLAENSPCIGIGLSSVASGTDIDGQPWNNPPSIGCDEWSPAPLIAVQPAFQIGVPPYDMTVSVAVAGQTPFAYFWSQNGVPIQDNGHFLNSDSASLLVNHFAPDDGGLYQVVVTNSWGSVTSTMASVVIHGVNASGTNPVSPFLTWATAATNIQDAINVAAPGEIVLVTNGVYSCGGSAVAGNLTNRVVLNKAITVMSANGYRSTIIQGVWDPISTNGPGAVRCAWVGDGAMLKGFTLQNGATQATGDSSMGGPLESGGGVWCNSGLGLVSNCVLTNNSAVYGGGASDGTIFNSLLVGNLANYGGGMTLSSLVNCTVVNNSASIIAAGTYYAYVYNSIVVDNYDFASGIPDNFYNVDRYDNSCTYPKPLFPVGDITGDPLFLDLYHISTSSPCNGAGNPADTAGFDLDDEPWNNPPSMGCSEIVVSNLVGPLSVSCSAVFSNLLVNRFDFLLGAISGRAAYVNWSFGDGPTYTNFGANSSHQWTNAGVYNVTLTAYNNDNPAGVTGNVLVNVQSIAAAQLQSPMLLTNGFAFEFAGQNQADYTIQYSTNLAPPITWQTLQTISFNVQSNIQILDPSWTNAERFYRVLAQ